MKKLFIFVSLKLKDRSLIRSWIRIRIRTKLSRIPNTGLRVPELMIESDGGAGGPRRGGPARPAAARLAQVPLTQPAQR
jgi:hypothetical protein